MARLLAHSMENLFIHTYPIPAFRATSDLEKHSCWQSADQRRSAESLEEEPEALSLWGESR